MAKISARGDSEHARWRHPETGRELVLTERGRVLHKSVRGSGFTLAGRLLDSDRNARRLRAADMAERRGMVEV